MFCRMAEVYAGFSEYTDAQVGRIVDYLEESGQLDNTIIFYCADNGASGEGCPNGSVNEGKIFGGYPDDLEQNLTMVDQLGSPDTYNHYPTGWAMAFSTPYRMFKRYTYQGGVCDPLVIHWPAGIQAKGEVRHQYHHCTDIVPTILEACGVHDARGLRRRRADARCPGVSMATPSTTPTRRPRRRPSTTRCSATAASGTRAGRPSPSTARWQARAGSRTTAGSSSTPTRTGPRPTTSPPQHPEKLEELKALWMRGGQGQPRAAAQRPADHRQPEGLRDVRRRWSSTSRCRRAASTPTTRARREIPERSAANVHNVSYKVLAEVELTPDSRGRDLRPRLALRRPRAVRQGRPGHLRLQLPRHPARGPASRRRRRPSGPHIIGVEFTKERMGENREGIGPLKLYIDDQVVGGAGDPHRDGPLLALRRGAVHRLRQRRRRLEPRTPVTGSSSPAARSGKVVFDVADDAYIDVEAHLAAAMARD